MKRIIFAFSHQSQKKKFFKIKQAAPAPSYLPIFPNQYPTNLNDNQPMISRDRPIIRLSPKWQIQPKNIMTNEDAVITQVYNENWKSPQNSYVLNVGLIGPVNSGKSELMGKLAHKISAVSPKANTTVDTMHAITSHTMQTDDGLKNIQLKYHDTPGLMYHKTGFLSKGWKVLSQIDFSLLVIDAAKRFDDMGRQSIRRLEKHRDYPNFMKALVLNKVDLVDNKRKFHGLISQIQKEGKFDKIFYTSSLTGYGIDELRQYLLSMAKPGEWEHPKEVITGGSQLQIIEQMMRQSIYLRTYKELPHVMMVELISFTTLSSNADEAILKITVQDQNQQRMVIGKKGRNLLWMIQHFKVQYAKFYQKEVNCYAKVHYKKNFGGREESEFDQKYHQREELQKVKALQDYFASTGRLMDLKTPK